MARHGMVASPDAHGENGASPFFGNDNGNMDETNLGPKTAAVARTMRSFDPGPKWKDVVR